MKLTKTPLFFHFLLLILGLSSCTKQHEITVEGALLPGDTKINGIQVLGTHNSYVQPIDTAILNYVDPIFERMMRQYTANMSKEEEAQFRENHPNEINMSQGLAYDHPDFPTQLDAGIRSLEIDVYYDPTGNRFSRPAAYDYLLQQGRTNLLPHDTTDLDQAGFKVLHMADLDFRSHYPTFKKALTALRNWSDAHPVHTPIFILIEAKDQSIPLFPNATEVLPFTEQAYDALDQAVIDGLGEDKLITPDQVRGAFGTLKEAVLANNWPSLEASLGKFIFLLLPGGIGLTPEDPYVNGHPSLQGRVMFVNSSIQKDHAAFFLLDNAIVRKEDIENLVKKGYLVRTRSDIETYEAKINDDTRAKTAFESGAQIISTDFFLPGNPYNTDYVVTMPNDKPLRLNPISGQ